MTYQIIFKSSVKKDIKNLPESVLLRIREAIETLAHEPFPHGFQKIRGYEGYYRIRLGNYRLVYAVDEIVEIICIIRIGHRRDVYLKM